MKEDNHYPILVMNKPSSWEGAWHGRREWYLSPCYPSGDGKWLYVLSHLFKATLKVTGELSTKFNRGGREDKVTNTYKVKMPTWFMLWTSVLDINLHSPWWPYYTTLGVKNHCCTFYCGFHRALASYKGQSFQNMKLHKQNQCYLTWDTDVHLSLVMLGQQWHL